MMKIIVLVLSLFSLLSLSCGQFVLSGQCDDNINLQSDFDVEEFYGLWYEVASSGDYLTGGDCSTLDFNHDNNTDIISVNHISVFDNFRQEQNFVATLENGTAKFKLNLNGISVDYWIMLLNPEYYAVAYSCENLGANERRVHLWQLGRQTTLINDMMPALINTTLYTNLGITIDQLNSISHSDFSCYTLPTIEENQPVIIDGQCNPDLSVVQNFDVARFVGEWHEISSYWSPNSLNSCARAKYTLDGDRVIVENSQVINQTLAIINGYATVASNDGSAKLKVVLEVLPNVEAEQDLWVLSTDYDNYAVLYTCVDLPENNQRQLYSWIVGREHVLSPSVQDSVDQVVSEYIELNGKYYRDSDQSSEACFYYPEPSVDSPAIFRGSCDLTIPVIQNFDAARYLGLWHDIESYPSTFQSGSCSNALYSLNDDGTVAVYNTQVINETLDTINGVAVIAFTDGSAKLNVTFPILNTNVSITTSYWVVDTDYDSYSFVYSCEDLPGNNKMVFGWKLSRTKQLTANALAAIEQAMSSIDVLDQRYFIKKDHSESGCFYYPEPKPGVPVVFPGQCDNSIQAVQNFNLEQFSGIWYEIEAYPKIEQPGQCINHDYTVDGNSFVLNSSQIVDQFLFLYGSNVTFSSNDGSAKFNIALNSNNTVINIPFWILTTDYTDYALAYSCVNYEDFRGIWSWKLSRSKELSPWAVVALDGIINGIEVLDNKYYEPIDQSDEACFYLPELESGEPVILVGNCDPNIPVVQNFDAARYMGTWRLIESYPSDFQSGSCNDATYSLGPDGVIVFNTQVINQTLDTITGLAVLATTDGSAKLLVTFPGVPEPTDYWVLDTDYDTFSLVYSCVNLDNDRRRVFSWKLSRTRGITDDATSAMNQVIDNVNVLNNRYYEAINQSEEGCFYYPEPDGNPVVFRGQCDMNIPVVPNFDVIRYLGLWYDVGSYPTTFQEGACASAYYSANLDGTVQVFNSQVVNETLDTIDGVAVIASSDGSAKLNVTFPIVGSNYTITTGYWVLDTDYDSYALVYTCEDIDNEYRIVFSWKLSRSKTLSANASQAIDQVIEKIQVLDERYYKPMDQSNDACFYYPEPEPDTPVVFPGSCDDSINVVQNFNLELFSGVWYEIESYPKEETEGQCLKHDYTVSGNAFTLSSSQVVDKYLDIYTSQVTFASNDGSAKLNIVLNAANDTVVNIPFWIIDTDYSSYALAYSCVSYDTEQRGVWSWKLSRTKQLTQEAFSAINSAMSDIPVIDERYYVSVDQSPDACFYLPDLQPSEPVIFVGQCDRNINVVQNFDPVKYTGVWRLIETYYAEFQDGSCSDATYALTSNGEVSVYNTQVINETLDTITGTAVLASDDGSAKLLVTFPNSPAAAEYWVLDTDYESYALVYSCIDINSDQRRVFSWKLSRTRELTNQATQAINSVINSVDVLDNRYYQQVNQSETACFYYPEVTGTGPVIFRGQCDQSLPTVQQFDATRYLGQWYDIESYPQEFQSGTCPDANYSLRDDGSVDVFNTQVVDQVLDTINGYAVVASTDGSAKLQVTFPIADTNFTITTSYWVLDTDYDSYALVYSCEDIDDEYRRVSSWKLSREKNLPTNGVTNINNIVNSIKVLDQRYYKVRGHTEEDCFYYPDNKGGPVYLAGQCDDNITVVENFNIDAFAGTWHEVSRFPSELQSGDCASSTFSVASGGSYILTQNIVYNERLVTMSGSIAVNDDGKGVIDAYLISDDGTMVDIRFYILDTDYTDYAVIYSCNDIVNDTKQVYSWKLAKSRTGFSQASKEKIDEVVTNNKDLYEGYYEITAQDNDNCFYYPEFDEPPTAIVMPGPCQNIQAMKDFDATQYLGRWFEIAKYPQGDQFGQCARAEYSIGDDGVVVYNTEVVNETLSAITGVAVPVSDGVLEVTFVISGVEVKQQLSVIDTDYSSYSLVYNCRELPSGDSQVSSWKLSRDKTLSPQANAIINDIIESTRGILEDYYVYTSQSDEDCFYIPEVKDNEPVVFRGQCEDISGVANFDSDKYLMNWWHEIERFSNGEVNGDCISTKFESLGSSYKAIDTQVFGLNAYTNTSTVTATNDGKIIKSVDGQIIEEYYVLATDYQTYSLIYSCKNVDNEHRQVWSAKYSTDRTLSANAQNEMATVIEQNKVLYSQFYKTVDQSDDACFHYPDLVDNTVQLPGQCDENIPIETDFDPVEYTGTWYQIERYPQSHEHKDSSCVGARYTLDSETGIINVVNWEVIDEELGTIEGTAMLTSDNGDAKLIVTLPVVGTQQNVTTELYVLKTDYISYSLVYSCFNLNKFERRVSVWKLSRTRSMPALGQAAIQEYTATRPEFHQPYFISVHHDDDCPEPSSSVIINSSITLLLISLALQRFF